MLQVGLAKVASEVCFAVLVSCVFLGNPSGANVRERKNAVTKPVFGTDVNVTCDINEIALTISKDYVDKNARWITTESRLCLAESDCCAAYSENGLSIKISNDFSRCRNKIDVVLAFASICGTNTTVSLMLQCEALNSNGSLSSSHYKFTNQLVYNAGSGAISRDIQLLKFHCLYATELFVTAKPSDKAISSHVIKVEDVEGRMGVFRTENFDRTFDETQLTGDKEVFVKLIIQDPGFSEVSGDTVQVVSVVRQCKLETPDKDHQLVDAGCPTSNQTTIYSNARSLEARIGVKMENLLPPDASKATIRCVVDLCASTPDKACETCSATPRRVAREVVSSKREVGKYILNFEGKELSTTILFNNKRESVGEFEKSNVTSSQYNTYRRDVIVVEDERSLDPKFLAMWIIGGLMFILIIVIIAASIIFCRR